MKLLVGAAVYVALHFSSSAVSAVVEYGQNDRDQWFADAGGIANVSTVDFTGYSDFTPVSDQWEHLGIHFIDNNVVTVGFDEFGFPNDGWGLRGEPDVNFVLEEPIHYLAADFPGSAVFDLYLQGQLTYTSQSFGGPGVGHFGGLISDEPFDQVRVYRLSTGLTFLDDLHFGPAIAVPAPASLIAIALPLFVKRRRRRCDSHQTSTPTAGT